MRQLKLVVSDFHIGTGRYAPDGRRNYLEDFFADEKFVEFLEYHRTGEFHDAEIELVINGDFFNLMQLGEAAPDNELFTEKVCIELMERSFEGHRRIFDALAHFARDDRRRVSFVMGNHDPGLLFDGVQRLLRSRIGEDCEFHLERYAFDKVHIEHGNRWDALNAFDQRRLFLTRGLPEPVVNLPWGGHYLIHVMTPEKAQRPYLDKVHPHRRFIRWAVMNDTWWLFKVTLRSLAFLFKSAFIPAPQRRFRLVDLLRRIFRYHPSPSLEREAKRLLDRERCDTVILGHTHVAMYREYPDGKVYVNTGTWNHVTSLEIGSLGKIVRLTYALLEWDEESGVWVPHLREWCGYHRVVEELYR